MIIQTLRVQRKQLLANRFPVSMPTDQLVSHSIIVCYAGETGTGGGTKSSFLFFALKNDRSLGLVLLYPCIYGYKKKSAKNIPKYRRIMLYDVTTSDTVFYKCVFFPRLDCKICKPQRAYSMVWLWFRVSSHSPCGHSLYPIALSVFTHHAFGWTDVCMCVCLLYFPLFMLNPACRIEYFRNACSSHAEVVLSTEDLNVSGVNREKKASNHG